MKTEDWFRKKLDSFKDDFEFRHESLILDLTENICREMKHKNINRIKLAERLNVSPPAVTKILNGNSNFTLKTLLAISDALEIDLKIDFGKKEANILKTTYPDKPLEISTTEKLEPLMPPFVITSDTSSFISSTAEGEYLIDAS